ncbi:hypothetical protein ACFSJW_19050, partial [Flavobacterium artemisiae]
MKTKITLLILLLLLPLWSIYSQTVTAVATPSTCAANGKIEITATGLPTPIIYGIAKSPYIATDVISSTSPVFSFLPPGNYYYGYYNGAVFVPSSNTISIANQYNTTSPSIPSYYSNRLTYCPSSGDPLGRVIVTMTGGNKPYTAELLDSGNTVIQQKQTSGSGTSATFDGVPQGVYTIRTTDACGTVVYAPNTVTVQPNVPYTDFTLAPVNPQPSTTSFNVIYNTPGDVCSGIASASVKNLAYVLNATISDITTQTGGPSFPNGRNEMYKIEIQNASGGFDVYDNITATQISSPTTYYPLPNDRSKWGLIKLSVTICGITKTTQLDLAQYNQFKITPFVHVGFTIYDDSTPEACTPPTQVEVWTSTFQSGGCQPITLDVTENGTSNTQHYVLPQNFKFKLDIGKRYTLVAKDGTGALLPTYVFVNSTSSPITESPRQTDPNNFYIDPAYYTPKSNKDKITFTDGLSSKYIGKSALVVSGITTTLGLVAPVYIESVSGPSPINLTVTPTASSNFIGLGNNLTPGTYKIRIRDSQCFTADYDIVLGSYIVSVALQNVTSVPSTTICDRYVKKGEIKVTAVGNQLDTSGVLYTVYGNEYSYPRLLSAPAGATTFISTDASFILKGSAVIPFTFAADLSGDYQIALSRKNDSRLLLPSEVFENTAVVPLTVQPNFPAFDLTQSGGVICPGNSTGSLTVKVNNAVGTVTYYIKKDTDAAFPATGQTSTVFTGLTPGVYVVKAKTSCYEVNQYFTLATLAQLTDVIFGDNTYCSGASLHFSTVAVGPVSSIVWTLPNNSTVTGNTLNIPNLTAANSGEYKVSINSTAGCVINGSTMVTVNPLAEVGVPVFNASSAGLLCQSVSPQFSDYAALAPNASSISYHISPPEAGTMGAGGIPERVEWNTAFNGTAVITAVASGCGTDKTTNFTVVMSPRADVSQIIAEGRTICPNENNILLEAFAPSISNPIFTWYDSNLGSASILGTDDHLTVSPTTTTTYYIGVEGTDLCVNEAGNRKAVTVTVNPVAQLTDITTSDQTICAGETAVLTATSPLVNPQFVWYTDPDLETSISNIATASVSPTVTTTYYVTVSADGVCSIPPPAKVVIVTVNANPVIQITNPPAVCLGVSVDITAANVTAGSTPNLTFTYFTNPEGTDPLNSPSTISTSGTYYIKGTDANGCSTIMPVVVAFNPLPTATIGIAGTVAVCQNAPQPEVTFTGAGGTAPYTFTYRINGGVDQIATTLSGDSATVSVPTGAAGSFDYTLVSVSDANSCANAQTGTAIITVNALPMASVTGTAAVCQNAPQPEVTFTGAGGTPPYTFTYKINNGNNLTKQTNGTEESTSISIDTGTAGIFRYDLVSVQDSSLSSCAQNQTGFATVTVNALPTATISGTTAVCLNGTAPQVTFTGANGKTPYTFTYADDKGATQTVSSSSTDLTSETATIAVPTTVAGTFSYTLVSVKDGSTTACEQTQSGIATVTVNPNAAIALSSAVETASQTLCISTPLTGIVYTPSSGATGAALTAGALPAGVTGSFADGVFTISGTPTASGTFNYTVTTTGGCSSASLSGSITVNPDAAIALSSAVETASQTLCISTPLTGIVYTPLSGATGAALTAGALPAGVTGSFADGVFTISGTPTAS